MENVEDKIAKKFKIRETKDSKKDPELERIKKEKGRIAELMSQGYSEEVAEEKARREDSEDAQEGE